MSELLQDILDFYLPNGLPSEEEIKKMTDDERNQLYDAQKNVISTFRRMAIAKMNEMELRMIKAANTLSKPPKLPTEEQQKQNENEQAEKQSKIEDKQVKHTESKQNKSITKTPTKSPAKSSNKTPISKTPSQRQQTPRPTRQSQNTTTKTPKFTEKTTKFKELEDQISSITSKIRKSTPPNPYIH